MKFNLLSRASAAAIAADTAADDKDAGPAPSKPGDKPADPAPAGDQPAEPPAPEASQDVVAAADVKALVAEADGAGFARANARMTAVFASDEGKANPSLAAFMLANSTAEAPAIIDQLKAQGPSAAAPEASPAAPPPATIANTSIDIGVDPKALAEGKSAQAQADEGWDGVINAHASARAPIVSAPIVGANGIVTTPAITRTGN